MSNQSVQTVNNAGDKIKVALALVAAIAGIVGFYFFSDLSTTMRAGVLVGGLVLALIVVWTSTPGREFIGFSKEAVRETKKVVWPTRKEAMQITAIVFVFALVMAVFLWGTDKLLEFLLYNVILGWQK